MPEHIRALVVILILSATVFGFGRKPASQFVRRDDFTRRRNLWYAVTLIAFLSQNFWIYVLAISLLLLITAKREGNPIALFFMLLFAVPAAQLQIPGFGIINYFISLSQPRLLALVILLPASLTLIQKHESLPFGRNTPDKLIGFYMLLVVLLYVRETSLTDIFRQGFYQFTDVFLPYFVVSRGLKNIQKFREATLAFVLAAMLMALIAIFEFVKNWLLYSALVDSLGIEEAMTGYLNRSDYLRATASCGHPIALGYVIAVAIGFYLFLQRSISSKRTRRLGLAILFAGLAATLSRGPWVGALVLVIGFIATGHYVVRRLTLLVLIGAVSLLVLSVLPGGEKILNLIPFIGQNESENIDYRERLLENSLIVIERNLWFGSVDYLDTPEMEDLRQGQGIIDIVNTYIQVALETGFIGLALFVSFFVSVLLGIYRTMKSIGFKDNDEYQLGRSLLATLAAALLIIFTTSSIAVIPIVYWSLAGLGVAYVQLVKARGESTNAK